MRAVSNVRKPHERDSSSGNKFRESRAHIYARRQFSSRPRSPLCRGFLGTPLVQLISTGLFLV